MATIIRKNDVTSASSEGSSIAFNFDDVARRADRYLEKVREQANRMVADAQAQADAIRETARQEGAQQARQEALAATRGLIDQQLKALMPQVSSSLDELVAAKDNWQYRWECDAIEMVIKVAERVVCREIERVPDTVLPLIQEAIGMVTQSTQVTLRLHPDDREMIGEALDEALVDLRACATVDVVDDDSLSRGGCTVSTEHGTIDQQVETRLARILEELTDDPST